MSERRTLRRKNKQTTQKHPVVDEKDEPSQESVTVPDTTATTNADKKRKWRNRLFGCSTKKENDKKHCATQESTCDTTSDAQTTGKKGKKSWWHQLFKCCKRRCRVSPAADIDEEERNLVISSSRGSEAETETDEQDEQGPSTSFSHQDEMMITNVTEFDPELEESIQIHDDGPPSDVTDYAAIVQEAFFTALHKLNSTKSTPVRDGYLRGSTIDCYGFPNIGQTCYMNSNLQSLLLLEDFIRSISCTEQVWCSVSEAQLLRRLMDIRDNHTSTDPHTKSKILRSFKEAVSIYTPEFRDSLQKDAHEFLTLVLNQIRSLSPLLQETAALMGRRYICPVEDHMVFQLEHTRRCKRCQARSTRQEEFTNLSLELIPGGSVEQMLQDYLKETELQFRCECGGTTSGQSSTIATLPRILILHLKRFRFTPSFCLEKIHDCIWLQRDIVVSSKQGGACYSLVSAICHFGSTGQSGHYICEGVHPEDHPDEPTDRFLTYNDSAVYETTGSSFCQRRQDSAYILFYKRYM